MMKQKFKCNFMIFATLSLLTLSACQSPNNLNASATTQESTNTDNTKTNNNHVVEQINMELSMQKNDESNSPITPTYQETILGEGYHKAKKRLKKDLPWRGLMYNVHPLDFMVPPYYFFSVLHKGIRDANATNVALHIKKGVVDREDLAHLEDILRHIDLSENSEVPATNIAEIAQCFLPVGGQLFTNDEDPILKRPAIAKPKLSHNEDGVRLDFTYARDGRGMNIAVCVMHVDNDGRVKMDCENINVY
jgi:hypothetical protein